MNKRQLRATYRKYLFSYTFEALPAFELDIDTEEPLAESTPSAETPTSITFVAAGE
jgi:hypothetical protein